jgi:hypothetical protein
MSAPHPAGLLDSAEREEIHIIADDSPKSWDDLVWTMLCGASCVAHDDGSLTPELDFYGSDQAHRATCTRCLARTLERGAP